jgi:hypothetical protein
VTIGSTTRTPSGPGCATGKRRDLVDETTTAADAVGRPVADGDYVSFDFSSFVRNTMGGSANCYRSIAWTDMNTIFAQAQLGLIDDGVLGATQIDLFGNINSTMLGTTGGGRSGDFRHRGGEPTRSRRSAGGRS